jgi:hypothetical protein
MRSWAALPVMADEQVMPSALIWSEERKFSADDIDLLFAFAAWAPRPSSAHASINPKRGRGWRRNAPGSAWPACRP